MEKSYDLILVGSGFASMFYLLRMLEQSKSIKRVLVLERGVRTEGLPPIQSSKTGYYSTNNPDKEWLTTFGLGGGSSCWWACTPRFRESDFKMYSNYGVGQDWPIGYDDLEKYYTMVEDIMSISGPDYGGFFRRSKPYPQKPHIFSSVDKVIKQQYPTLFFQQPTARAFEPAPARPKCCASGVCHRCPVSAKFILLNDLKFLFHDERVEIRTGCEVLSIEHSNQVAHGVRYRNEKGTILSAKAEIIGLGANGIFNPFLMMKSGLEHKLLGKGINDQISHYVNVDLDGLNGFDGSTSVTGHGYMWYDGQHRVSRAACLLETSNVLEEIRLERGKFRQRVKLKFIFEDMSQDRNYIRINPEYPEKPEIIYAGYSDYTQRGIDYMKNNLPSLLSSLPIERIDHQGDRNKTEAHIQCTTIMGNNPETSVVDEDQKHHELKNLQVLGSSVFTTAPPANPTLTISALSMRAADKMLGIV